MNGKLLDPIDEGRSASELNHIWHGLIETHTTEQAESFWDWRFDRD